MATFDIFLLASIICSALATKKVDNEVVCLYHEWTEPVEEISTTERFAKLVPQSGAGTTENNILLHLYTNECTEGLSNPFFIGAHYQTGPAVLHLAQMNYPEVAPQLFTDWKLPSNCSLFVFIPIEKTFSDFQDFSVLQRGDYPSFTAWNQDNRKTQVQFTNDFGKEVKFYWYEKNPRYLDDLAAGQVRTEHTFLGHIFKATDAADDSFIDLYVIDGKSQQSISRDAMNTWCASSGIEANTAQCIESYELEMIDWAYKFWARKREALNFVQPQIVPNFTEIGFKKIKVPDEVYQPVLNFWKERKANDAFDREGYAGPVLNQYSSPTFMAHLRERERQSLKNYFQRVLAEWSGYGDNPDKLEMTSLYGIRKYERDAVLAMHVDTCSTHVISAIVNVDSKLDEGKDWPLQIYDHQGVLHELTMKPGEAVFYESAKCGHSRRKPLPGDYYANLFIHFKPAGHWNFDWF